MCRMDVIFFFLRIYEWFIFAKWQAFLRVPNLCKNKYKNLKLKVKNIFRNDNGIMELYGYKKKWIWRQILQY